MAGIYETRVTLRVIGDDLDPNEITSILGHAPTSSQRKGDLLRSGHALRCGMWRLQADDSKPGDLETQIESLLSRLTPDLTKWGAIKLHYRIDLFCGLFMEETNEGLTLSPAILSKIGERGIELGFDIYDPVRR